MKIYYLLLIYCFISFFSNSLKAQCKVVNNAFLPGERISYDAYYNWGIVWVHAGEASFAVDEKLFKGKKEYYLMATGNSLKSYDWFFKVRDTMVTYFDNDLFRALYAEKKTLEGNYCSTETYLFDYNNSKVNYSYQHPAKSPKKFSMNLKPCQFDLLTATFYARAIDFSSLKLYDKIPINLFIEEKPYSLYIRYLGKEIVEDNKNRKYNSLKFSALLVEGTIFKSGEDLFVWVTDDENKIPIKVEAKILVGSIKVFLNKYSGLRRPINSVLR